MRWEYIFSVRRFGVKFDISSTCARFSDWKVTGFDSVAKMTEIFSTGKILFHYNESAFFYFLLAINSTRALACTNIFRSFSRNAHFISKFVNTNNNKKTVRCREFSTLEFFPFVYVLVAWTFWIPQSRNGRKLITSFFCCWAITQRLSKNENYGRPSSSIFVVMTFKCLGNNWHRVAQKHFSFVF